MRGRCGRNTSQEVRGGPFEVLTLEGRPEGHIDQREKLFSKRELQVQRLKAATMLSSFIRREGAQSELRSESQVQIRSSRASHVGLTIWIILLRRKGSNHLLPPQPRIYLSICMKGFPKHCVFTIYILHLL